MLDGGDHIEREITSMTVKALLQGVDLWTYSLQLPQLYAKGGVFYQQVERDLGIENGKHCSIPALQGKVLKLVCQLQLIWLFLVPGYMCMFITKCAKMIIISTFVHLIKFSSEISTLKFA